LISFYSYRFLIFIYLQLEIFLKHFLLKFFFFLLVLFFTFSYKKKKEKNGF